MWSISTHDIPSIDTFERAAQHWADQKPWRGEHGSWRQLGNRRTIHKHMVKLSDERGYEMVLYQTPVVTYYANGDLALRVYDTPSTVQFAWCVCPNHLSVISHSGGMYWQVPTTQGKMWVRPERGALELKPVSEGVYEITSPVHRATEWKLDRSLAAATRKKLSHYDRWQKITHKMLGSRAAYGHVHRGVLTELLADPANTKIYNYVSTNLMPVSEFLQTAYELEGARYIVPVPMGELPKRQK